ncbi:MAG: hypothetical protein NXI02_16625 [Rhodobacteraceae bacterium]|nr:hypothetical protein [Paracoccaceae bacterium]
MSWQTEIWTVEALNDRERLAKITFVMLAIVPAIVAGLLTFGGYPHRCHPLAFGPELIVDTIRGIPVLVIMLDLNVESLHSRARRKLTHDLWAENMAVVPVHPGWIRTETGGSEAVIPVVESATGLISLIDGMTMSDTGSIRAFDGSVIA